MSINLLLSVLADGQFHSGEQIGETLGVSRAAVWKQLQKAQALGLPLESVKGKGYRIPGGLDLLDRETISSHLDEAMRHLITHLHIEEVVESTNSLAMARAAEVAVSGYVCTAEQQTAGRGRRGRVWHSPYASNLYVSVVWEFGSGAAALEGLSLAVGVVIVNALQRLGIHGAQLKWPNDILYEGKKLAGVLLEMVGDAVGSCQVVVGIGLNVSMHESAAGGIDQLWTDASSIVGERVSRNKLLGVLLSELMPLLAEFEREGFGKYHQQWQALDAYGGQDVLIKLGNEAVVGKAVGVDKSGAVIIETPLGRRVFSGGEISLRGVDDIRV